MSQDYETSYFIGLISAVIIFIILVILYYAFAPVWVIFGNQLFFSASQVPLLGPAMNGLSNILGNFTFEFFAIIFALLLFVIIYIVILPFLREPNQRPMGDISWGEWG